MDREFNILMAFSLLINRGKLLPDILMGNHPLHPFSQHLPFLHLKVLLCNTVEDLDASFGIGKDNRLF